ncbi:ATP-binding protein [Rubrivivax gelatinosus]|uniref:ATP-binding protein n=1 Tax=Rubrivivax gelatinosus TaxID=28068 RepID=UPI0002FC8A28|nr:ATP-binding protein [Rubrivivax gelatinosus]
MSSGGRRPQSLQRRLLLALLVAAPLLWAITVGVATDSAQTEVDEMFDGELIRMAGSVHGALSGIAAKGELTEIELKPPALGGTGAAKMEDMALAAWDADGKPLLYDPEGARLPWRRDASGFVDMTLDGISWRVYYQQAADGRWCVAAAQRHEERDELIWGLLSGQLVPWLLMLPALMLALAWASRRALEPVRRIAGELEGRDAESLRPLPLGETPAELLPIVGAMNALFERIEATRQRERRFTADAAHELRTPLAVLRGELEALEDGVHQPTPELLRRLQQEVAMLAQLVGDLHELALADVGALAFRQDELDLVPLVRSEVGALQAKAAERGLELQARLPAAALPVSGDERRLRQLLLNLLSNSLRYTDPGGTVRVELAAEGTDAVLDLQDSAPGVPEELLPRLFERFFRVEASRSRAKGGSGLGLAIARSLAEAHGGRLEARPSPLGGLWIRLVLPRLRPRGEGESA